MPSPSVTIKGVYQRCPAVAGSKERGVVGGRSGGLGGCGKQSPVSFWLGLPDPRVVGQSVHKHCDFFIFQDLSSNF